MTEPGKRTPPHGSRFDSERAREAGRKSGEARRRKAEQQKSLKKAVRATLAQPFDRTEVGLSAFVAANKIVERVLSGEIPIRHGQDAAAMYTALISTARLEAGEATSHTAHLSLSSGQSAAEALDKIREAQAQAGDGPIESTGGDADE